MRQDSIREFRGLRSGFQSGSLRKLVVGIDVAKRSHAVWFGYGNRELVKAPASIRATRAGFDSLGKMIAGYQRRLGLGDGDVVVGLEPTGHYHKPVANYLHHRGYYVVCVSGLSVKRQRDLQFRDWAKTDKRDSQVICELIRRGRFQFYMPNASQLEEMRVLLANYRMVSVRAAQAQHRLISGYLSYIFPEIEKHMGNWKARWITVFLSTFPTPDAVRELDKDQFIRRAAPLLKGKPDRYAILDQIYEDAVASVGLKETPLRAYAMQCAIYIRELQYLLEWKSDLEHQLAVLFDGNLDFKILTSVPGVGTIVASTILAAIGSIDFFDHQREMIKFFGLNLSTVQSGAYRGRVRISKCGKADVRHALYLATLTAIRRPGNSFYAKYRQLIEKNPEDRDLCRRARIAVCIKMVRVIFHLLKSRSLYHPRAELKGRRQTSRER